MRSVTFLVAVCLAIASATLASAVLGTTLATGATVGLPKASIPLATLPGISAGHVLADNSRLAPVQTDLPTR